MPTVASVVHSNPDILSGSPVFVGTRVPLQNFIDYLAAGDSLDTILDAFRQSAGNRQSQPSNSPATPLRTLRVRIDESLPRQIASGTTPRWCKLRDGRR